jgi:hypothetical protein
MIFAHGAACYDPEGGDMSGGNASPLQFPSPSQTRPDSGFESTQNTPAQSQLPRPALNAQLELPRPAGSPNTGDMSGGNASPLQFPSPNQTRPDSGFESTQNTPAQSQLPRPALNAQLESQRPAGRPNTTEYYIYAKRSKLSILTLLTKQSLTRDELEAAEPFYNLEKKPCDIEAVSRIYANVEKSGDAVTITLPDASKSASRLRKQARGALQRTPLGSLFLRYSSFDFKTIGFNVLYSMLCLCSGKQSGETVWFTTTLSPAATPPDLQILLRIDLGDELKRAVTEALQKCNTPAHWRALSKVMKEGEINVNEPVHPEGKPIEVTEVRDNPCFVTVSNLQRDTAELIDYAKARNATRVCVLVINDAEDFQELCSYQLAEDFPATLYWGSVEAFKRALNINDNDEIKSFS